MIFDTAPSKGNDRCSIIVGDVFSPVGDGVHFNWPYRTSGVSAAMKGPSEDIRNGDWSPGDSCHDVPYLNTTVWGDWSRATTYGETNEVFDSYYNELGITMLLWRWETRSIERRLTNQNFPYYDSSFFTSEDTGWAALNPTLESATLYVEGQWFGSVLGYEPKIICRYSPDFSGFSNANDDILWIPGYGTEVARIDSSVGDLVWQSFDVTSLLAPDFGTMLVFAFGTDGFQDSADNLYDPVLPFSFCSCYVGGPDCQWFQGEQHQNDHQIGVFMSTYLVVEISYDCVEPMDTTLAIYTGPDLAGLSEVASNDDTPYDPPGDLTSAVSIDPIPGETYWIQVGTKPDQSGTAVLEWGRDGSGEGYTPSGSDTVPTNDDFADALEITGNTGQTVPLIVDDLTVEGGEPAGSDPGSGPWQTMWFKWIAPLARALFDEWSIE